MTNDDLQLLREFRAEIPPPNQETRRRIYGYATGKPTSRWHQPTRLARVPPLRLRFVLPVAAAICAAVVGVIFTGALGGAKQPNVIPGTPPPDFLDLTVTRNNGSVSSVALTVRAATLGGTAQVQVVQGHMEGSEPSTTGHVVYQEQVPMANVASPPSGPPGTVALSEWSGRLSPSDWSSGCQNAPYWITIKVSPANPTTEAQGEFVQSGSFQCSGS